MSGKIIKGNVAPGPAPGNTQPGARKRGVIHGEVFEAQERAAEIVRLAEERARQVLAEAENVRKSEARKGFEEGRQQGLAQVSATLVQAKNLREEMISELEPQVVDLAMEIARKILGTEIKTNREAIVGMVTVALEKVRQQREIYFRVHPSDAPILRERRRKFLDILGRAKDLDIREDPDVTPGGCIIESEVGTIDAQLETQLMMIEKVLRGEEME